VVVRVVFKHYRQRRAQQVIEERKQQEEQARQELDARMPPVQQIEGEPSQVPVQQLRQQAIPDNFTVDGLVNSGLSLPDAVTTTNDLLNRGEFVLAGPDNTFRRVNEDERIIPLGNPDESYVYTVPRLSREGTELNDGYTVEFSDAWRYPSGSQIKKRQTNLNS